MPMMMQMAPCRSCAIQPKLPRATYIAPKVWATGAQYPKKVATMAPTQNWPSAPMLNRPPLNASATERPVAMYMALLMSSSANSRRHAGPPGMSPESPNRRAYARKGFRPEAAITIMPTIRARPTEMRGTQMFRGSLRLCPWLSIPKTLRNLVVKLFSLMIAPSCRYRRRASEDPGPPRSSCPGSSLRRCGLQT